ncbi:MAG: hypothetical protein J6O51_07240 [Bacteroidales bacterium]|nr:hypothetical protein [Bacteroidales bacterium]
MKRFLLILALCAATLTAAAQSGAQALLKRIEGKRVSFDYSLTTAEKVPVKHSGSAVIEGNCYRIDDNGMEIWCNGKTRWTVDNVAREVYIEAPGSEAELLISPEKLLGNVKNLVAGGTSASGQYTGEGPGKDATFVLTSIKTSEPKGDRAEFTFSTSSLKAPWVITDLR